MPELYIKGPADARVRELVAQAPGEVRLVDNQPFSFSELERRKLQVHSALEALGFKTIGTGFSVRDRGRISAGVSRQSGLPNTASAILAALSTSLPASLRGEVSLTVNDIPIVKEEEAFGGMRVTGASGCTSGWPVYDANGQTGVTTAGHCDGINTIDHPGHGAHGLSFRGEHRGMWGDIEWHTSAEVEPARFYATATEVRRVIGVRPWLRIVENEDVCLYGRSSNTRGCARVSRTSFTCTGGGDRNDRLVITDRDLGIPGDSGGTWSYGETAYGSHEGNCAELPGQEAFTVADLYDEAIGVRVRTDQMTSGISDTLEMSERLISDDGRFHAVMQTDGNFVVYQGGAIWAASWCGMTDFGGSRYGLVGDTGFQVKHPYGYDTWTTKYPQNQAGCPSDPHSVNGGTRMVMQNDGNLVIYNLSNGAIWSTRTGGR